MTDPFVILTVCTGNICRSPAMERLLAQLFVQDPAVEVRSGGTHAHDGEDMQEPMKRRVADYGADAEGFVAQQVTAEMVAQADLILAATAVHVEDMLAEVPSAAERMFTIGEFGRLLDSLPEEELAAVRSESGTAGQLAALTAAAHRARSRGAESSCEDDVVDPYMLPESVYDEAFRQIREPVETLGRILQRR
ncbi:low molecular weight phosphatase family protein [Nesterenkonia sp.]|uniref:arsenate reductase/protein-tyrosine-phosphatase family protein n=1 Tax=Nesterenkonia sp. TaxID=704201 RepID=UPI00262C2964|nr:low molecular weight phosphatase family protein [Nesterenkonia sp.]